MNIETEYIAWMAGLLEGEGCFWFKKPSGANSGNLPIPAIKLVMADEDIISRVADLWGVGYRFVERRKPHWSDQYQVNLTGAKAIEVCRLIRPWMGIRRQAKVDQLIRCEWARNPNRWEHVA
jgi:hypothetical protein